MTSNDCCYVLTVGGHEEAGVDLLGVAEVWLDLLPAGIKLPLMDAAGFDVQHVITDLPITAEKSNINKEPFVFCLCFCFVCPRLLTLKRIREIFWSFYCQWLINMFTLWTQFSLNQKSVWMVGRCRTVWRCSAPSSVSTEQNLWDEINKIYSFWKAVSQQCLPMTPHRHTQRLSRHSVELSGWHSGSLRKKAEPQIQVRPWICRPILHTAPSDWCCHWSRVWTHPAASPPGGRLGHCVGQKHRR